MNFFAAEQLPDPNHFASIGWVCVILAAIIFGLRQGMGFVRDVKDKPSPGEVQQEAAGKFVHKHDFHRHVEENRKDHENLFSKIGGVDRGNAGKIETQIATLRNERAAHDESMQSQMTVLGKQVASLETATEMQNEELTEMKRDIKTLLQRRA